MIRVVVLAVLLAGCPGDDDPPVMSDGGMEWSDAGIDYSRYWPCFGWQVTDYPNVELCAPGCSNYGTIGKYIFNTPTSCEIADGIYCDPKYIDGPYYVTGTDTPQAKKGSCCLYVPGDPERVERISCR